MGCHAQYLSGELAEGGVFATQEQAKHRVVRTLHIAYAFLSVVLLFSSPFAIQLNRSRSNPRVLSFTSDSPPHSTWKGEGVGEKLCGFLLPIEAKPEHPLCKN